jgi:hypothetical protein
MYDNHDERQIIVKSWESDGKQYEALFDQDDGNHFNLSYVNQNDSDDELGLQEQKMVLKEMTAVIKFVARVKAAEGNYQD